jgi:hypothetical protein
MREVPVKKLGGAAITAIIIMVGAATATPAAAQIGKSSPKVKTDIVALERLPNGLTLYRFRYWWSNQFYVGVMAPEVREIRPDAVLVGWDGFDRVDYGRLGLHLQTWEDWLSSKEGRKAHTQAN